MTYPFDSTQADTQTDIQNPPDMHIGNAVSHWPVTDVVVVGPLASALRHLAVPLLQLPHVLEHS